MPTLSREELIDRGMVTAVYAAEAPDRLAVISQAGQRTFAELNARANQVLRTLRARGVEPGSTIALVCANRPEFVEVYEAVLRGGMRLTAINWHLTADEITYIVDDSEAAALVGDARFANVLCPVGAAISPTVVKLAVGGAIDGFSSYEDAVAAEPSDDIDDPRPGTHDAVHVRHDGTSEGRAPGHRQTSRPLSRVLEGRNESGRERAQLVHRAALPRRAADDLADCAACWRLGSRVDGRLVARGDACDSSTSTASRRPIWCRRCSTVCSHFPTT